MKSVRLSAIILAKNSEDLLPDCIRSISFCDEIIVVDTGSTDGTVTVAKQLDATVVHGAASNFSENRNLGMRQASGEWILYVDTDERVDMDLQESIKQAVQENSCAAYKLKRKNFYFGKHAWSKIEYLERLFKKSQLREWYGALHETARVDGTIGMLQGYLLHFTHRDLTSMLEKTISWSKIEAQLRYNTHHPKIVAWRLIRVMITGFWDSYVGQQGWRAGTMGLVESIYQSYSMFITYATLWEMQKSNK